MERHGESLLHFLQLPLLPIVVVRYQLHSLEHVRPIQRHLFAFSKVRLEDVEESLDNHLFNVIAGKLLVNSIEGTVELGTSTLVEYPFLL